VTKHQENTDLLTAADEPDRCSNEELIQAAAGRAVPGAYEPVEQQTQSDDRPAAEEPDGHPWSAP